jgi:hypothetical protein
MVMESKYENELGGKSDADVFGGVSGIVNDNGDLPDDSHFQLRESDLIIPGLLMTAALVFLAILILLGVGGCASTPQFPPAGPQQKTASAVINPNCTVVCIVTTSQSTALEDIKNNTGQVTGGTQTQSTTQSPQVTTSPEVTVPKKDE